MMLLNREVKYRVRDHLEAFWRFDWGRAGPQMSGRHSGEKNIDGQPIEGWWAWRKKPGLDWECLGSIAEAEILKRLEEHRKPLTDDDRIDLHLWLANEGWAVLAQEKPSAKVKLFVQK